MYEKFKKIADLFQNGVVYSCEEVFQKLSLLEEEGIRAREAFYLFSKEMEEEVDKEIIVEERKKIRELYLEEVIEEEKVWRKRTIAVLDLYWSVDAQYVQVRVRLHFSHWVVSTYEEDTGTIQWIETEEGVLYKMPEGWEVFASAEVLDSGMDWSYHDGATYPRVKFKRKDGSEIIIINK
ncbi:hypothetical protein [Thermicanus aegyptius]|uniref:hypothetical protein n=1 Tax=Thermicanus aegyptius TaxID=94009 RepID=UPI000426CF78|nr:hypothetical protein [Thermicanus aegyptius]